ncbi:MAG: chemotaxis protein CheW, partial [Candidatus Sericytochromatia bacterium]
MIFITFISNEVIFCIESKHITEIVRMVKINPSDSDKISGFLDYRGDIIPVIESSKYIRNTSKTYQIDNIIAICDFNSKKIAILTDDLKETLEVKDFSLEKSDFNIKY